MASGQPFSDREKEFIRLHVGQMSYGMIAQELGKLYPEDNSGYRSFRSVQTFAYRERIQKDQLVTIRVPAYIISQAKRAGKNLGDIERVAKTAIEDSFTG